MGLAALYEEQINRAEFRRRNVVRQELIALAAQAEAQGDELAFEEDGPRFTDRSWLELIIALRFLNYEHLVWLDETDRHGFSFKLTDEGLDLARRDAMGMRRRLPTTSADDEHVDLISL